MIIELKELTREIVPGLAKMPRPSLVHTVAKPCLNCGGLFCYEGRRAYEASYCGHACKNAKWEANRIKGCLRCGLPGEFRRGPEEKRGYCGECRRVLFESLKERPAPYLPKNCPAVYPLKPGLSIMYQSQSYEAVTRWLKNKTVVDPDSGCWEWIGRRKGGKGGRLYGIQHVIIDGKRRQFGVHRLMLEAKLGRPFVEHSHHVCANSICCNPDHLQLATANENAAEMLARKSFEARIAQLEEQNEELEKRVKQLEEDLEVITERSFVVKLS